MNLNAFSLTVQTYNRYLNDLVKFTTVMLSNSNKKPSEEIMREYYIKSSRFYFVDKFLFASMFCDEEDIYYLPEDDPKCQAIDSIRQEISIEDDEKIHALEEEYTEQLSASIGGIKKTQGIQSQGYGKLLSMLACGAYYYIGSNPKFRKQTL